jgi:hypothetical protein
VAAGPDDKAATDFLATVAILEANIRLFHEGLRDTYRVVATELRKLLCDGRSTLLPRVFADVRFHKFHWTSILERTPSLAEGLQILLPGELEVRNGRHRFRLKFANTKEQMTLDAWLDQPFLGPDLTVREFIRSVANKEGAHADPKYNETLARAKSVKYCSDESHLHCIVGLAEYLLDFVRLEPLQVADGVSLNRNDRQAWERA